MLNKYVHAVILDLDFAGYGIVRSLTECNIPVIGFYKDKYIPEARTRLCSRKIYFFNNEQLIDLMNNLPEARNEKPVLFLTSDEYVSFYLNNRKLIDDKYLIDIPNKETIDLLFDKNKFSEFALQNDILIPKSLRVNQNTKIKEVVSEIDFPAIYKPFLRNPFWIKARMPKAFFLNSIEEFKNAYDLSMSYEKNMIIQEWIPGADENIHYCLTYFDKTSKCIGAFTGYKLRQWPVGTGSTATTAPSNSDFVANETNRILKMVNFCGFGSIEFKKHGNNGKFYLMEPTAGRSNQQEYVATLNGVNLPLIAYNDLTGNAIKPFKTKHFPIIYVDELAESASTIIHLYRKLITFKQWYESLSGYKAYRYFNKNDISVFFGIFLKIFKKFILK